jgi:hypothetical protein
MNSGIGEIARTAWEKALELAGTECDAGGERRRAVKIKMKGAATTVFQFAEEFALKRGDKIREIATESYFTVIEAEPISQAGVFNHFEVTTQRTS